MAKNPKESEKMSKPRVGEREFHAWLWFVSDSKYKKNRKKKKTSSSGGGGGGGGGSRSRSSRSQENQKWKRGGKSKLEIESPASPPAETPHWVTIDAMRVHLCQSEYNANVHPQLHGPFRPQTTCSQSLIIIFPSLHFFPSFPDGSLVISTLAPTANL